MTQTACIWYESSTSSGNHKTIPHITFHPFAEHIYLLFVNSEQLLPWLAAQEGMFPNRFLVLTTL